ncbi:MAG: acyl-CoA reductase [Longimicrobiales bacterium]|nr:acyl-CoA reductase [Longimicrobiales bacterium]
MSGPGDEPAGSTPFDAWSLPDEGPAPGDRQAVTIEPSGVQARFPAWNPGELVELCSVLRRNRLPGLARRSVDEIAAALGAVGSRFLREEDELRDQALNLLPDYSGISPPMARQVLDGMARDWTTDRIREHLRIELGDAAVLDRFRPDPRGGRRMVRALGPELSLHICASTVPGVSVTSLIRALLVKSAVVLKPGRSDLVLPVLFARGLRQEAPELADAVAVSYWVGGTEPMEDTLLAEADSVVVYGSDPVVRDLRNRTPVTRSFVAYRHRVGAVLVGREALGRSHPPVDGSVAERVARAIAAFDQRGCVSPHVVYVEGRGGMDAKEWAEDLAGALATLEDSIPSGPLLPSEGSMIQQLRGTWEMRAAAEEGVAVHHGGGDAPWTVLVEPDPGFVLSCTGRVVRVRPVESLHRAVEELAPVGRHLQTVSVEGVPGDRRLALAESLAEIGAVRITSAKESPWPPPWWHHDGEGPLGSLLRWTDLEGA